MKKKLEDGNYGHGRLKKKNYWEDGTKTGHHFLGRKITDGFVEKGKAGNFKEKNKKQEQGGWEASDSTKNKVF